MNIPKVRFKAMSLEENIELVKWSYNEKNDNLDLHKHTIECFPELENNPNIEEVVTKSYKASIDKIIDAVEKYNELWEPYNSKFFRELFNYLEVENNVDYIDAKIGIIPVFPRDINNYSFSISINIDDEKVVETVAHETLHFYWFKKWLEIYPDTPKEHLESPYIEWLYSEMVTDPILNNKPFNEMFSFTERGYDSFYKNEELMNKLRNIYMTNEHIIDKIKNGYELIKNNMV